MKMRTNLNIERGMETKTWYVVENIEYYSYKYMYLLNDSLLNREWIQIISQKWVYLSFLHLNLYYYVIADFIIFIPTNSIYLLIK